VEAQAREVVVGAREPLVGAALRPALGVAAHGDRSNEGGVGISAGFDLGLDLVELSAGLGLLAEEEVGSLLMQLLALVPVANPEPGAACVDVAHGVLIGESASRRPLTVATRSVGGATLPSTRPAWSSRGE